MTKTVPWWTLIPTVLFTALAMWAIGRGVENPSGQTVTIVFPGGGQIDVRSEREPLDYGALMTKLFSEDFSRNGVLGWLRDKQHLYSIQSEEIAAGLRTRLCDPIPSEPRELRQAKARECAEKPAAAALRRLSFERAVPFHYVSHPVLAGVQAQKPHRPGRGRVNVCKTGGFVGQRLQVFEPINNRMIEVQAGGTYVCEGGEFADIQLDPDDAKELFKGALDRIQKVVVVVI